LYAVIGFLNRIVGSAVVVIIGGIGGNNAKILPLLLSSFLVGIAGPTGNISLYEHHFTYWKITKLYRKLSYSTNQLYQKSNFLTIRLY